MSDRSATPILAACAAAGFIAAFGAAGLLTDRAASPPRPEPVLARASQAATLADDAAAAPAVRLAPVAVPALRRIHHKRPSAPRVAAPSVATAVAAAPTPVATPVATAVPVAPTPAVTAPRPTVSRPTTPNVGQTFDSSG
jgi:hypothetical protein